MITDETSDLALINQIKSDNDSDAVTALVNRHTGMYINVVKKYSCYPDFLARANVDDLKDEKYFNIYSWALKYDPSREMKFGSYVGQMTKFLCQNLLHRGSESVEFSEAVAPTNDTSVTETSDRHSAIQEIKAEVKDVDSALFRRIFKARFDGQKPRSWRQVGKKIGMSHEGCRKVYEKHIGQVKENLST